MAQISLNLQVDSSGRLGMNHQIANQLIQKIQTGEILPDSTLPSENSLATELKVSRDVVRRAYKILKNSGLIQSEMQHGWRVTKTS